MSRALRIQTLTRARAILCVAAIALMGGTATPFSPAHAQESPPLTYVDRFWVLPQTLCERVDPRICESDSITVVIHGTFPNRCYRLESVELLPPDTGAPPPQPPILRLNIRDQGCTEVACSGGPVSWSTAATLAPLPGNLDSGYVQIVEVLAVVGCPPVARPAERGSTRFFVSPSAYCRRGGPCTCLMPVWVVGEMNDQSCQAWIAPDSQVDVILGVRSPTALAAFGGSLYLNGEGLSIRNLQPIGAAAGMRLDSEKTLDGERFVLSSDQGPAIAATPAGSSIPVLRVTLGLGPTSDRRFSVSTGWDMWGLDAQGQEVRMCPPPDWAYMVEPTVSLCLEKGDCDFNSDRQVDVRDVVLMSRCAAGYGPCPPEPVLGFDCDLNHVFDMGDAICCALGGLSPPGCLDCPADSTRSVSSIAMSFGAPRQLTNGLEVPLRIDGADRLAGARLRIRYPADRLTPATVAGNPPWVTVHKAEGDVLSIALLDGGLSEDLSIGDARRLDLALRFNLRPGQQVGGELRVVESDLSAADGEKLVSPYTDARLSLAGEASISLGPVMPNPAAGEARLVVTIDRPGEVDAGIYDLAGRRVATVFRGSVNAGSHPLFWDGRRQDGSAAAGGVYFAVARTQGVAASRRLVLLQRR